MQTFAGLDGAGLIKFDFEDNPITVSPSDRDFNDALFALRFEPPADTPMADIL